MCQSETRDIRALLAEMTEALEGMVWQHCSVNTGEANAELDSMSLGANTEAIELLIRVGRLERVGVPTGNRVFARRRKQPGEEAP